MEAWTGEVLASVSSVTSCSRVSYRSSLLSRGVYDAPEELNMAYL